MVEVAKTSNQFSVNDSQVSSVRQTVADIGTRIDVEERLTDVLDESSGIPVLSEEAPADLIEQITGYFDEKSTSTVSSLVDNR
jgi:hypothetical protein